MTDTEKRLHAAIDSGDADAVAASLVALSEAERADLEPGVARRADELHRSPDWMVLTGQQLTAAHVAWLGTGTPASLPPEADIHDNQDGWYRRIHLQKACASAAGHRVLADRRPKWLPKLVDEYLHYGHWLWDWAWRLIVDGLVPRPDSELYLRGVAAYAGFGGDEPLPDMLDRDPALLEVDLPALLALPDGIGALVHGDVRVGTPPARIQRRVWSPVLAALPSGNPLRERILTGLLEALGGDVGGEAAAYRQFLTELRPTAAEFTARRQALLRLAGHRVPSVVGFAVKALGQVDRAGQLDPADAVDRLGPVTAATSAGTARAAVKLIGAAMRRQPDLAAAAAIALVPALSHSSADVQRDAVHLLQAHATDERVAAVLADARADLARTVAGELGEVPAAGDVDLDGLLAEARRRLAQAGDGPAATDLAAAIEATTAGAEPPPVTVRPWRDARPTAAPVTPIESLDELVEELLRVVDRTVSATSTMERALDGLAASGTLRPADFGRRVGPLIVRANDVFATDSPGWGENVHSDFCYLVANWMEPARVVAGPEPLDSARGWLVERIREVALVLQRGTPTRLLALPTDEADWIDPIVLAERALAAGDAALDRPVDVAVAVARLAPWGRSAALDRLRDKPSTIAAVVRAACGSGEDVCAAPDPVRRAVAWQLGQPHAGPPYLFGDPEPPPPPPVDWRSLDLLSMHERAEQIPMEGGGICYDTTHLPEFQAARRWFDYLRREGYSTDWAASQWPGDTRWIWRGDEHAARSLRRLLEPDEPVGDDAMAQVLRQIADETAERRTLATDVLTRLVADGRVTSDTLAAASSKPWTARTAGRVVDAFDRTAATSALHRAVVRRAVAASVSAWHALPAKPLCALLFLLDEWCTADGCGLGSADARRVLAILSEGRSKTAGLARRVLAHPSVGTDWPPDAAAAALEARVARLPQ